MRNPSKWRSKQICNQVNFFFGSREDRLNLSCGEPESCYFRKNGEEGRTKWVSSAGRSEDQKRVNQPCGEPELGYFRKNEEKGTDELNVWGAKVVLLQDVHHRIAHSKGIPSKIVKLSEGERTNPVESSPEGRGFFLGSSQKKSQVFLTPHLTPKKKRRRKEKEGGDC